MGPVKTFLTLSFLAVCGTESGAAAEATLTTLVSFTAADGYAPLRLVEANSGEFYGIAGGGTNALYSGNVIAGGSVFKMTRDWKFTALAWFDGNNGDWPVGLVQGSDGNFYGTTLKGNNSG